MQLKQQLSIFKRINKRYGTEFVQLFKCANELKIMLSRQLKCVMALQSFSSRFSFHFYGRLMWKYYVNIEHDDGITFHINSKELVTNWDWWKLLGVAVKFYLSLSMTLTAWSQYFLFFQLSSRKRISNI